MAMSPLNLSMQAHEKGMDVSHYGQDGEEMGKSGIGNRKSEIGKWGNGDIATVTGYL